MLGRGGSVGSTRNGDPMAHVTGVRGLLTRASARGRRRRRVAAALLGVTCAAAALTVGAGPVSAVPPTVPNLTVGSWDTALRPWMADRQQSVNDVIAGTKLDVLALQGVWTQGAADAITHDARIAARYPYSFYAPANGQFGYCSLDLPRGELEDFITSITVTGVDPRTALQPSNGGIDPFTSYLALGIAFRGQQLCVSTILSLLQDLPPGADPLSVIDTAYFAGGEEFAHHGSPGLLILSKAPLQDVQAVSYDSTIQRPVTVYARLGGVRMAFAAWPRNYYEDVEPGAGFLTTGAQQPQLAQDAANAGVDLIIGEVNTGPGYQQDGYDVLTSQGYRALISGPTRCPDATHASYPLCNSVSSSGVSKTTSVFPQPVNITTDNIFTSDPDTARCFDAKNFATTPVSDHIGIQVTCGSVMRASVTVVAPNSGPVSGGQPVTVTGTNFTGATKVLFGTTPAAGFTVDSPTQITATTPAHAAGVVHVRVQTAGLSAKIPTNRYKYIATS